MTSDARAEMESRAERCVRRGDFAQALGLYRALADAFPQEAALFDRIAQIEENLQPAELLSPKARTVSAEMPALSLEQEGERLFASGDVLGAAAAYRRAVEAKPDNQLLRERLVEIFQLAQQRGSPPKVHSPPRPSKEEALAALLERVLARRRPGQA